MFSWKLKWEGLTRSWNNPEEGIALERPLRDVMMTLFTLKLLFVSSIPNAEKHPLNGQCCLRRKIIQDCPGSVESVSYKQGIFSVNWGSFNPLASGLQPSL